jgi:hypothetical protein
MLIEGSSAVDAAAAGAKGAVGAVLGAMGLSEASLSKEGWVERRKAYPRSANLGLVPMAASDAVAAVAGSASAS